MNTGLIVVIVLAVLGIAALIAMRRRKATDTDGRYLISRPGIAGLHVHPSISRATAEQMADLIEAVYLETWPVVRETYADACRRRHFALLGKMFRWHTTHLEPGPFGDSGKWTAYGITSGIWAVAVGCSPWLMAEEIHSSMRGYLGDDVYYGHDLFRAEGETVSRWIRDRYGKQPV